MIEDLVADGLRAWGGSVNVDDLHEIHHDGRAGRAWRLELGERPVVAKLAYDQTPYVLPGLRIALRFAMVGLATGPPVATRNGGLAVEVATGGRPWTLAVLTFEPGTPIDLSNPDAPGRLGELLAVVHTTSLALTHREDVPAEVLNWWRSVATARDDERAMGVLDVIRPLSTALPQAVVYGDPSPEVLDDGHRLALIDWGTPSWGPVVYDVAAWSAWLARSGIEADQFLDAYHAKRPLLLAERTSLADFRHLVETLVI